MAAPKIKLPRPYRPPGRKQTAVVNPSTGFVTGGQSVKRANKASAAVKPYATRGTSVSTTRRAPAATPKAPSRDKQLGPVTIVGGGKMPKGLGLGDNPPFNPIDLFIKKLQGK
jgi:hypothetical protein